MGIWFLRMRLLLLLSLHCLIISIAAADISPGSTLRASNPNQTWTSPNRTFALGFVASPAGSSAPFVAAISYSSVPIWIAGGAGGSVDSGASLEFLPSGNLRLVNGSGALVWQSGTAGRGISTAVLEDSGNLALRNATAALWSTFDNPTDTIVPLQRFPIGRTLNSDRYSFYLQQSGNLTLRWNTSIVYWTQGLNSSVNGTLRSPYLVLQSIGILSLFDPTLPSGVIMAYSSDYAEGSDLLRYVKLEDDGNLRIYSYPRRGGRPTVRWAAVEDQCQVFGYCGNLGICSYNDTSPVCGCPSENFDPVDPRDRRKGCRRKMEIADCPGSATMLELDNAQFLTYPPELSSQVFFEGISACRLNCLVSSSCFASTSLSDGTGLCYLKLPEFVSGYQSPALPGVSYLKVCGPVAPNPPPASPGRTSGGRWRSRGWAAAAAILAALVGLILLELCLWWWCCRSGSKLGVLSAQYALLEYASGAPLQFSYRDLQRATRGFKEKLGEGGFGSVYKGTLANRTVVAVKQLEGIEQGEKQFRMEVATISSTHHLNLVRLIGFCSEGRHRLLVYEFMRNGSLDSFLFAMDDPSKVLNWEVRFNIALGTARGITYLHEECRDCIVHCDIKPENILIDDCHHGRVSDFGLAKLINPKDHRYRTLTSVRGTRGYLAPEWLANLPITSKSDVYSYGMVLLEIVSGRRNFEVSAETGCKKFSAWAYEELERGNIAAVVDGRLAGGDADMEQVERAVRVSFWCIQEQPSFRPAMGKVVQMLEGIADVENPPPPKAAAAAEGSVGGGGGGSSSAAGSLSFVASAAPPQSSSSLGVASGFSSSASGRNTRGLPSPAVP